MQVLSELITGSSYVLDYGPMNPWLRRPIIVTNANPSFVACYAAYIDLIEIEQTEIASGNAS